MLQANRRSAAAKQCPSDVRKIIQDTAISVRVQETPQESHNIGRGLLDFFAFTLEEGGKTLGAQFLLALGAPQSSHRKKKLGPKGLASFLKSEREEVQESSPDIMGLLGALLDTNRDGSVIDDIANIAGALLSGR